MLKINAAAWRSRRLHRVSTAFAQRCWRLHSAHLGVLQFFKRCVNAVKPLSHQTALPQRLYSVLKPCHRAVGTPRNTPKISNVQVIACTQRPHSVPTASSRRSHSVFTARKQLLQRVYGAHTARSRRAHSVLTAHTQRPHGDYSV